MEKSPNNVLMNYMANPKAFTVKKWLQGILKDRFAKHVNITERVSYSLVTEADLESFGKLISDIYEIGYMKAVTDYQDQLQKMGIKAKINMQQEQVNP